MLPRQPFTVDFLNWGKFTVSWNKKQLINTQNIRVLDKNEGIFTLLYFFIFSCENLNYKKEIHQMVEYSHPWSKHKKS